jgi:hypothetical protein
MELSAISFQLSATARWPRAALGRNQTGLVGAPLVGALVVGTHEGCPYETRKMFANKTRIYVIAIQRDFS